MHKISVVATTYNHERYIAQFLHSIFAQTHREFELILVDDCSTDSTVHEIEKIHDARLVFIRNKKNMGPAATANIGINHATGHYIGLINGDDVVEPGYLECGLRLFQQNPDIAAVAFPFYFIDEIGQKRVNNAPAEPNFKQYTRYVTLRKLFFDGNIIPSPGQMFKKETIQKNGRFNHALFQTTDYDFNVRTLLNGDILICPEKLIGYRITESGLNIDNGMPESYIRHQQELGFVLDHYLNIDEATYYSIFHPDEKHQKIHVPFEVAKMALKHHDMTRKLWGFRKLLELMSDVESYLSISQTYSMDYADFVKLLSSGIDDRTNEYASMKSQLDKAQKEIRELKDSKYFKIYETIKRLLGK